MKNKSFHLIWEYLQLALAIFLARIGLKAFFLPNEILDGGVTGVSIWSCPVSGIEMPIILPIIGLPFF
ncbi:hypothetical protein E0K83_09470 [Gramella sp. BOM4]|nr:hypothetical protein [Christiangramia bathymodioli]